MWRNNLIIIVALVLQISCQQALADESSLSTLVNESYLYELNPVAFAKDRDEINFTSGQVANNCTSFLKAIKLSTVVESVNDQIIHTKYLVCEVYDLVKGTKIAKQQFKEGYGRMLSSKLDLTSFRSSLNRRARSDGPTLQEIGERFLTTDASSVTYDSDEWLYRLELIAITDINRDGIQDWIVILEDRSKVGNYHAGETLVIMNPSDSSLLKAKEYSKIFK